MRRLCLLALACAVGVVAVYPPVADVNAFVGLHFFYYEPMQDVVYEMYLKSNQTLDYHVWLGSVNGAQCSKDQAADLLAIGDDMLRIAYEEPTGAVSSHLLDMGVTGSFKQFYRATMWPNWVLAAKSPQQLTGCSTYDADCLATILKWRALGPVEPQTVAAGAALPILFFHHARPANDHLIDCSRAEPSPFLVHLARLKQRAMAKLKHAAGSSRLVRQIPIAGYRSEYQYLYPNRSSAAATAPATPPAANAFTLYVRNLTAIEFKHDWFCNKNQYAYIDPMRHNLWRLVWRGNHNKNFQTNLAKPMQRWYVGGSFAGLDTPVVKPTEPHPYPHLYSASFLWAELSDEQYVGANNDTALIC